MATRKWLPALALACFAPTLVAQAIDPSAAGDASRQSIGASDPWWHGTGFGTMRIAIEDGRPLPGPPTLTSNCATFELIGWTLVEVRPKFGTKYGPPCHIFVSLAGYRTARVGPGSTQAVLKRLGDNEGSAVSFTSLSAPKAAAKQFDGARAAVFKHRLDEAEACLRRAIELYPEYGAAWHELGLLLERRGSPRQAEVAYNEALEADPRFLPPYIRLAELAAREQRWDDALRRAEQAQKLNAIEFPGAFYWAGVAEYNLGELRAAEKDAMRAMELDTDGAFPRVWSLLGLIWEKRGDPKFAVQHYREFLARAPSDPTAASVRTRVDQIERRLSPPAATP